MKKYLNYLFILGFLLGCGGSKVAQTNYQVESLKALMAISSFLFRAEFAYPMATQSLNAISNAGLLPPGSTAGAIQINGTSSFLKVQGDTVSANLPYYGERRFGGGYGSNTGVAFKDISTSYQQIFDTDKNRFEISFTVSEKMELYTLDLTIYPNKTANLIVSSTQRNSIRYSGTIGVLEK